MSKRVLITGACGFVGRHISRSYADDDWEVVGIGHGTWNKVEWRRWGIDEWHSADVTLDSLITYAGEPDAVVHCAGSGSVTFSMSKPYQDFQRTVETTISVLEYARLYAPFTRIVYPSSAGVYGMVYKLPIAESDLLHPTSPYGVHKYLAENLCDSYAKHFNISVAVVRLFSVFGAGLRKQLLWDASQKITRGENSFFGTGEEIRDWLHVKDAASLLTTATQHASTECPIVNGGSSIGVTVREVLTQLFAEYGRDDLPIFSGMARAGDPPGYVADISLARRWGWQPKIELRQGLREYAEWFKSEAK
jgi:UDP-glucose 4-epimerase